jgi:hypothetical protein
VAFLAADPTILESEIDPSGRKKRDVAGCAKSNPAFIDAA